VINLSKYVNVEGKEVCLQLDNFSLNKVRYRPSMKVKYGDMYEKDEDGNYIYNNWGSRIPVERPIKTIPEKWLCFLEKANKKIEVTYQYLQENLKQRFLDEVREAGIKKSIKYIKIPPGRSTNHNDISDNILQGPKQKYYQKEGERTCLNVSFANMLYYCNSQEHAMQVFNQRLFMEDRSQIWSYFNDFLKMLSPLLSSEKVSLEIESLHEEYYYLPVVTYLKGLDGKDDHTVTIYKGLIFDGNFTNALHISKNSLNACCSSNDQKATFVEFKDSYVFEVYGKYLNEYDNGDKMDKKRKKRNMKKKNQRKNIKFKVYLKIHLPICLDV
jgi:hypothetical protein